MSFLDSISNMGRGKKGQIELKSRDEIAKMRRAGIILQRVLTEVCNAVEPGVTTAELDKLAKARIKENKAKAAFLGLYGFPGAVCISVNEEIVHGIPGKRELLDGDIVSLDCGVTLDGFNADMARTVAVGSISADAQRLMDITKESLAKGIAECSVGKRLGDIGFAIQQHVEKAGFSIVEDYGGHGIGRHVHEDPRVENFGRAGRGERLRAGLVLAIEPMVNIGVGGNHTLQDDWTVVSEDGSLSAHFEHTVAITDSGPQILTAPEE